MEGKRQYVIAHSIEELEYKAVGMTICEVIWIKQFIKDLGLTNLVCTTLLCDNQIVLAITANPVQHESAKHVEMDYHFIRI